jgi:hypothetical protein
MKKCLMLILIFIVSFSCKKDDSEISIVGYWEFLSITPQKPFESDERYDADFLESYNEEMECFDLSLDFLENGSIYAVISFIGTDWQCETVESSGTWEINSINTKLYMDFSSIKPIFSQLENLDIKLTEKSLILVAFGKFYDEGEIINALDVELRRK